MKMTYDLPTSETEYMKVKTNRALATKFLHPAHEHDHFQVEYCVNARERRVLKFPSAHLEPREANDHHQQVVEGHIRVLPWLQVIRWGLILKDVISKEVNKVRNKKECTLPLFLYHLYCQYECLTPGETTNQCLFLE